MREADVPLRMLSYWGNAPLWILLLGIGLFVGGCNVFDVSGGSPNTVDALLSDAQTALATGETTRAVRLLERAFEKDSTDVRVRVELGTALFADRGLDLFVLRRATEHLVEPSSGSAAAPERQANTLPKASVCTDGARPEAASERYRAVPLDADPLGRLAEHRSVLERVRRLVVEGVLERRPVAFSNADVTVRRKGYLVGAVTVGAGVVIDVREEVRMRESTLYLDREAQPTRALVACANTEEELVDDHEALCDLSSATRRAAEWLRTRNRLSGSDQEEVIVGRLQAVAEAASARTGCS